MRRFDCDHGFAGCDPCVSGKGTLHHWLHKTLFLPWLSPIDSSLAYVLMIVGVNLAVVAGLYRKRIFLRI